MPNSKMGNGGSISVATRRNTNTNANTKQAMANSTESAVARTNSKRSMQSASASRKRSSPISAESGSASASATADSDDAAVQKRIAALLSSHGLAIASHPAAPVANEIPAEPMMKPVKFDEFPSKLELNGAADDENEIEKEFHGIDYSWHQFVSEVDSNSNPISQHNNNNEEEEEENNSNSKQESSTAIESSSDELDSPILNEFDSPISLNSSTHSCSSESLNRTIQNTRISLPMKSHNNEIINNNTDNNNNNNSNNNNNVNKIAFKASFLLNNTELNEYFVNENHNNILMNQSCEILYQQINILKYKPDIIKQGDFTEWNKEKVEVKYRRQIRN